jgi:membrane peptidoglycan carboxypeptidase
MTFAAGKTGTSENIRDTWFIGSLVAGPRVGNEVDAPMNGTITGGSQHAIRTFARPRSDLSPIARRFSRSNFLVGCRDQR